MRKLSCESMELKVKNKINGKLKIFIGKNDISQKLLQCSVMLLFSHILIMSVQPGTLISMKKRKRKYK